MRDKRQESPSHKWSPGRCAEIVAFAVLASVSPLRAELRFYGALPAISTHGALPYGVAAADLDHDSVPDLIVATNTGIHVRRGLGRGFFDVKTDYATGAGSSAVTVADFNADGHADLAVVHSGSNALSILLGRGDGSFETPVGYPALGASSVAAGELSGDSFLDIAVARGAPHSLEQFSVLLGNGDGTFRPRVDLEAQPGAAHVALGDVNADGHTDVVVGNWLDASISVLLSLGDGTFTPQTRFETGVYCRVVALGDLNHDARLDVVAMDTSVSVLLGNGDGSFGHWRVMAIPGGTSTSGTRTASIAIGDLDSDGNQDIAVSNQGNNDVEHPDFGGVVLYFGAGDGTFPVVRTNALGLRPYFVHLTELNGDEKPDLLVANGGSRSVSTLLGRGGGAFGPAGILTAGPPTALVTADLDADGTPDLAAANGSMHNLSVLRGLGNGTFGPRRDFNTGWWPNSLRAGDVNGDGKLDLVAACRDAQTISVLLGGGDCTFGANTDFGTGSSPSHLALADFVEDGRLDAAVLRNNAVIGILPGLGDGFFAPPIEVPIVPSGYSGQVMSTGDLDGDAHVDFVLSHYDDEVRVYLGRGDGTVFPSRGYSAVEHPGASAIADLDGDGNADVVVAVLGALLVFPGDGAGDLRTPIRIPVAGWPGSFAIADLDGDDRQDLVYSRDFGFGVLLAEGGLTFRSGEEYETGRFPTAIALADMDRNGRLDVVVTSRAEGEVFVLLNEGPTPVTVADLLAQCGESGVVVTWRISTSALHEVAAVRVHRAPTESAPYVELTEPLEPAPRMSFLDATADPRCAAWYRLVVETHDGSRFVAGPVQASPLRTEAERTVFLGASELESGAVSILYRIGRPSEAVSLEIFDVRGRRIRRLVWGAHVPGEYTVHWDRRSSGARAGRGVYLLHLSDGGVREARKLALLHD